MAELPKVHYVSLMMLITAVIQFLSLFGPADESGFLVTRAFGTTNEASERWKLASHEAETVGRVISPKILPMTQNFPINRKHVTHLVIRGTREDAIITKVLVHFAPSGSLRLYALEGRLKVGAEKFSAFAEKGGSAIAEIEIGSMTPTLLGPRGGVLVGVQSADVL